MPSEQKVKDPKVKMSISYPLQWYLENSKSDRVFEKEFERVGATFTGSGADLLGQKRDMFIELAYSKVNELKKEIQAVCLNGLKKNPHFIQMKKYK